MSFCQIFATCVVSLAIEIGHCGVTLAVGEIQQFSKKLRCIPERRRMEGGGDRFGGGQYVPNWRLSGLSAKSFSSGSGDRNLSGRSGSDGPSWRKEIKEKGVQKSGGSKGEEGEVQSSLKNTQKQALGVASKKVLFAGDAEDKETRVHETKKEKT